MHLESKDSRRAFIKTAAFGIGALTATALPKWVYSQESQPSPLANPLAKKEAEALIPNIAREFLCYWGITDIKAAEIAANTYLVRADWRAKQSIPEGGSVYETEVLQTLLQDYPNLELEEIDANAIYTELGGGIRGHIRRGGKDFPPRIFLNLSTINSPARPKLSFKFAGGKLYYREATVEETLKGVERHEIAHLASYTPEGVEILDSEIEKLVKELFPNYYQQQSDRRKQAVNPDEVVGFRKEGFKFIAMVEKNGEYKPVRNFGIDQFDEYLTDYTAKVEALEKGEWFLQGSYADPVDLLNLRLMHEGRITKGEFISMYRNALGREYLESLRKNPDFVTIPFDSLFKNTFGLAQLPPPSRFFKGFFSNWEQRSWQDLAVIEPDL